MFPLFNKIAIKIMRTGPYTQPQQDKNSKLNAGIKMTIGIEIPEYVPEKIKGRVPKAWARLE